MIVFSAFTPHSPLLLEEINSHRIHEVQTTLDALEAISHHLYATHPDTILLISELPSVHRDTLSIFLDDPYKFDLSEFGNFDFELSFRPDIHLIDSLQRALRTEDQRVTLMTEQFLHYASAVPLKLLGSNLPNVRIVPIGISQLGGKEHFQFGQALKDTLTSSMHRIAVIASGDLSHTLTSDGPVGFHKDGPLYDKKIKEIISHSNPAGLLSMEKEGIQNAQETSYRPLCTLYGIMERISHTPKIHAYEAPFGVGYLSCELELA